MQRRIIPSFCQMLLLAAVALLYSVVLIPQAQAGALPLPFNYFAFTQHGQKCELPDGNNGVIALDDKTCCPGNAAIDTTNGDMSTRCLIAKYITPTVAFLSVAAGILVVISIVYGGVEIMTAGSDVSRAAAGRSRIIQALIALFAYMALVVVMQFLVPGGII